MATARFLPKENSWYWYVCSKLKLNFDRCGLDSSRADPLDQLYSVVASHITSTRRLRLLRRQCIMSDLGLRAAICHESIKMFVM